MTIKDKKLVDRCTKIFQDALGENLTVLDMREVSSVADFFIIVTGNSVPHLNAISDRLGRTLKEEGQGVYRKSGTPETGWIVYDYFDVVVHMMTEEIRGYYDLESLWSDAPQLAVAG